MTKEKAEKLKKEIEETEIRLLKLKKEYRKLITLDGTCFQGDEELCEIDDFPLRTMETSMNQLRQTANISTIGDLVISSPDNILRCRGLGPAKFDKLSKWMTEKGLHFIS